MDVPDYTELEIKIYGRDQCLSNKYETAEKRRPVVD
jgi:hypothetical protein